MALVEALEQLFTDDESKCRLLGKSGKANAREFFLINRAAQETMDLILEMF